MQQRTQEERQKENLGVTITSLAVIMTMYSVHDLLIMMESIAEGRIAHLSEIGACEEVRQGWQWGLEDTQAALSAVKDAQAIRSAEINTSK